MSVIPSLAQTCRNVLNSPLGYLKLSCLTDDSVAPLYAATWSVSTVDRLAAAKVAAMLADDRAVLTDHDAVGISLDLDRATDGVRDD
jgi:hypothetical protein